MSDLLECGGSTALSFFGTAGRRKKESGVEPPHFKALDQNVKPLVGRELSVAVLRAFDELAAEPQQIVLRLTEAADGRLGL